MNTISLKQLVSENIGKSPKLMNVALKRFAKENGTDLVIDSNYDYAEKTEDIVQGIEVTKDFEQILNLLGATMSPSYEQLLEMGKNMSREDILETSVAIKTEDAVYEVEVFEGILGKKLSLWMDTNELKEKTSL